MFTKNIFYVCSVLRLGIIINENWMTNLSNTGCSKYCTKYRISDHIFDFQCQCIQWLLFVSSVNRHCVYMCMLSTYQSIWMRSRFFFFFFIHFLFNDTMIWNRIINFVICYSNFFLFALLFYARICDCFTFDISVELPVLDFRFSTALSLFLLLKLMTSNSICIFASTISVSIRIGIVHKHSTKIEIACRFSLFVFILRWEEPTRKWMSMGTSACDDSLSSSVVVATMFIQLNFLIPSCMQTIKSTTTISLFLCLFSLSLDYKFFHHCYCKRKYIHHHRLCYHFDTIKIHILED